MSRKLFTFLLSELQVVRVICQGEHCKATVEVPVAKLGDRFQHVVCPFCQTEFVPWRGHSAGNNPLARLSQAIQDCQAIAAKAEVEFVLPDPS